MIGKLLMSSFQPHVKKVQHMPRFLSIEGKGAAHRRPTKNTELPFRLHKH
jgi:hypothetical protein